MLGVSLWSAIPKVVRARAHNSRYTTAPCHKAMAEHAKLAGQPTKRACVFCAPTHI